MCSGHYVTALTSLMDTQEGFQRLLHGLKEIDDQISLSSPRPASSPVIFGAKTPKHPKHLTSNDIYQPPRPQMPIALAMEQPAESLS